MKKNSNIGYKAGKILAFIALNMGVASSQATCVAVFHQPKIPHGMGKFIRKK